LPSSEPTPARPLSRSLDVFLDSWRTENSFSSKMTPRSTCQQTIESLDFSEMLYHGRVETRKGKHSKNSGEPNAALVGTARRRG
jgi:hypothetical protein